MLGIVQVVLTVFLAVAISVVVALIVRIMQVIERFENRLPAPTEKHRTRKKGGGPKSK